MSICTAATCENNKKNSKFLFHQLPHDVVIKKKWISSGKCTDIPANENTFYVCSQHSLDSDIERDSENEHFIKEPGKKEFLKDDAVRSQHPPSQQALSIQEPKISRKSKYKRLKNPEIVKNNFKSEFNLAFNC